MLDVWLRQENLEFARFEHVPPKGIEPSLATAALARLLLHAYVTNVCQSEKPMLPYMVLVTPKVGCTFCTAHAQSVSIYLDTYVRLICGFRQCWISAMQKHA